MILTILLLFICVLLCMLYLRFNHKARLICKIPGPRKLPIVGNGFDLILPMDELFRVSRTFYYKYGPVVGFSAINYNFVNIYDPEDVEVILSNTKFIEKQQPYTFLKPWLCEGLLISNGQKWQQRRKMLTQAFHFNILKKYMTTFIEQSEAFLKRVEREVGKDKTNLLPLISKTTLQTMCVTTMGTTMNEGIETVTKTYFDAIHAIGEIVVQRLCQLFLFIDWTFRLSNPARKQRKILQNLHKITTKIINERKVYLEKHPLEEVNFENEEITKKGRLAMLDLLLKNEKDGNIDIDGIREEVDTFLFEGHDTTAAALCFLIMHLANDTTVQNKIVDELNTIFGESMRSATVDDLSEMKYLECCIKESLRLYPSVPMIGRYIKDEVKLGNYTIPAGTFCHIHIYDIHHRADLFPEPKKFIPERFLPQNSKNRHPYAYIPFSAGPRNCIGQKFAILEIKMLISSLLRRYRVEAVTKLVDLEYKADLILRPKHPIYVRFRHK